MGKRPNGAYNNDDDDDDDDEGVGVEDHDGEQ